MTPGSMRILITLTYYYPHYSGLTVYAVRLAKALAERGHQVTVLTSQFNKTLPRSERIDGVEIIRAPVLFRISKGVIMPTLSIACLASHQPGRCGQCARSPTGCRPHCDSQPNSGEAGDHDLPVRSAPS